MTWRTLSLPVCAVYALLIAAAVVGPRPAHAQHAGGDRERELIDIMMSHEENVHMVAIEALVVEINEERTRDLGLNYGYHRAQFDDGRIVTEGPGVVTGVDISLGRMLSPVRVPVLLRRPDGVTDIGFRDRLPGLGVSLTGIDVGRGAISARLRALLETGDASIRTRPVAIALNNTPVQIQSTTRVPYLDSSRHNRVAVAFEPVGVRMDVLPEIMSLTPGEIRLRINRLEVSSVASFITTDNIDRPVFTKSETTTEVTLNEGETFVVGGLKARRQMSAEDRVPILGSIPVLGWLFKSQEELERNVDVLFFITPHILAPGENFQPSFHFENHEALGLHVRALR